MAERCVAVEMLTELERSDWIMLRHIHAIYMETLALQVESESHICEELRLLVPGDVDPVRWVSCLYSQVPEVTDDLLLEWIREIGGYAGCEQAAISGVYLVAAYPADEKHDRSDPDWNCIVHGRTSYGRMQHSTARFPAMRLVRST